MIIRALDSNGDWTFGHGLSNYLKGNDAIAQNVRSRLLSWVGDCFFAQDEGIDWKGRLDVGQKDELEQELKKEIINSEGVVGVGIVTATLNSGTRGISITYSMDTIYSKNFQDQLQLPVGG